ncbi:hypothetical protein [Ramlibacter sp.]|uniref:hypothetical protein n=1 Tax=Ramlibacter sp. TaxID=1917967 RepID=UPI003D1060D9
MLHTHAALVHQRPARTATRADVLADFDQAIRKTDKVIGALNSHVAKLELEKSTRSACGPIADFTRKLSERLDQLLLDRGRVKRAVNDAWALRIALRSHEKSVAFVRKMATHPCVSGKSSDDVCRGSLAHVVPRSGSIESARRKLPACLTHAEGTDASQSIRHFIVKVGAADGREQFEFHPRRLLIAHPGLENRKHGRDALIELFTAPPLLESVARDMELKDSRGQPVEIEFLVVPASRNEDVGSAVVDNINASRYLRTVCFEGSFFDLRGLEKGPHPHLEGLHLSNPHAERAVALLPHADFDLTIRGEFLVCFADDKAPPRNTHSTKPPPLCAIPAWREAESKED